MKILIVDDDQQMRKAMDIAIKRFGYQTVLALNGKDALRRIDESIDVVISDIKMPGMNGVDLLKEIKKLFVSLPVILITAYGTVQLAVKALKLGASDFILKPFDNKILKEAIERASRFVGYETNIADDKFIGSDGDILRIKTLLKKVADTDIPILLSGESGTGKEVAARYIYNLMKNIGDGNKDIPFVAINCSAIPENLFESEMFGYEKGAFTDAVSRRIGKFEEASGGILFADEITEMPYNLQAKLLRVLQEKKIVRIGGKEVIPVNFRFVSSTNRSIKESIIKNKLRKDLFFRINALTVELPPLKHREGDIGKLANHFLQIYRARFKRQVLSIQDDAMKLLMNYEWPGNIRELENVIERAVALSNGKTLNRSDIFLHGTYFSSELKKEEEFSVMLLADMEKKLIYKALEKSNGNKTKAADMIGVTPRTLRNKLKEYED